MGNSIVATFGGDTGPLKAAFSKAAAMAKESAREQATAYGQLAKAQQEQLKLEKLRATAAGNHAIADAIQDEIDLRTEAVSLAKELGIAEHEAIKLAQERLALNRKIAQSQADISNHAGSGHAHAGGAFQTSLDAKKSNAAHGAGSGTRAVGDLLNLATSSSGAVSELGILQHTLGTPLAIAGGGLAVIETITKIKEAVHELNEATKEGLALTFKNLGAQVGSGPESVRKSVEEKKAAIEKIQNSRGELARLGDGIGGILGPRDSRQSLKIPGVFGLPSFDTGIGGGAVSKSLKVQLELERQCNDALIESGKLIRRETADRDALINSSKEELELLLNQQEGARKINEIRANAAPGASNTGALVDAEQSAIDKRAREITARGASARVQIGLEQRLTQIHADGAHEEEKGAQARLIAALQEVEIAKAGNSDDLQAAKTKLLAVQTEFDLTHRRRVELVAQLALQTKIADLIAPASEKNSQNLDGQLEILDQQISTAKPDELERLKAERAGVLAARREDARAKLERGRRIEDSRVEQNTGFGDAEHLSALSERIRLGAQRIEADEKAGTVEADQLAASHAQQAVLIRERDHLALIKARDVGYAKEGNKILEADISRHSVLAERLRTELSFSEQINQARDNGDSARVKELQQAKQLTLEKQAQAVAIAKADRTRLSLSELAKNGEGKTGAIARRIVRLEERAAREAGRGNQRAAQKYQSQADKLRNGLDALKDGEKPRDGSVDDPGAQKGSRETDFKGTFKKRTPEEIEAERRRRQVGPSDFKKLFPTRDPGQAGGLGISFAQLLPLLAEIAANTGRFVIKNR